MCSSLTPRSRTGSRPGGKKAARRIDADYFDWALADFSGYIAADELYDGPFCILSIVDNRTFKRLIYQVLDHDPTHVDIEAFFDRFHAALKARGLTLKLIFYSCTSVFDVTPFVMGRESERSHLHSATSYRKSPLKLRE